MGVLVVRCHFFSENKINMICPSSWGALGMLCVCVFVVRMICSFVVWESCPSLFADGKEVLAYWYKKDCHARWPMVERNEMDDLENLR